MDKKHTWLDENLLRAICGTPKQREMALHAFFTKPKLHHAVKFMSRNLGGNDKDYEDIFQDAFIIFDHNIRHGKFKNQSNLDTYFIGIARKLWFEKLRKTMPVIELNTTNHDAPFDSVETEIIDTEIQSEHQDVLQFALSKTGEKCKELLILTGFDSSNDQIADKMGFSSGDMARKEVYRCREKFRNFIKEHPRLGSILKRK